METHICDKKPVEIKKINIKELLKGRKRRTDEFICGACCKTFQTICVLHEHCVKHNYSGSYFFDHVTRTAFPKYDYTCSYTQTKDDILDNVFNRDTVGFGKVVKTTPRDINMQHSMYVRTDETPEDDISANCAEESIEEDQEVDACTDKNKENCNSGDENFEKLSEMERNKDTELGAESPIDADCDVNKEECDSEDYLVTIKNVQKTLDGVFTFEMDKTDAHLFDITATSLLDKIKCQGEDWIGSGGDFKIKIPVKKSENSARDDNTVTDTKEQTDEPDGITKESDFVEGSGGNVGTRSDVNTEDGDEEVELTTVKKKSRGRPPKKHVERNPKVTEKKKRDEMYTDLKNVDNEKSDEHEVDLGVSRRSGRKRKVSSRLMDSEWETPKQMRKSQQHPHKHGESDQSPVKDTGTRKKPMKLDKELAEIEEELELIQKSSTDLLPKEASTVEEEENVLTNESDETAEVGETESEDSPEVNSENTCPADLSASEVLLSLSKGSKDNNNKMDDVIKSDHKTKKSKLKKSYINKPIGKMNVMLQRSGDEDVDTRMRYGKRGAPPPSMRKDYVCQICGKVGNLSMINYHRQSHSNEKAYTCESCGKSFKTRACLTAHVRQHGEWKFKCDRCPAMFYRKQYLTSHLLTHTGELPHKCTTCNKAFRELYILHRHINNVHKNIRRYPCDICNQSFFRPNTRDIHRTRHFEPTLKCHFCTKMFKAELDRKKHEFTHTGEKLFYCPKCSTGFTQLWPYYRHMWKKHNIGKEDAKNMRLRNRTLAPFRNLNKQEPLVEEIGDIEEVENQLGETGVEFTVIENIGGDINTNTEEAVNIIYEDKLGSDVIDASVAQFKDGQIIIQQSDGGLVTQTGEGMIVQTGEDMVIQSTSQVTDLKGIYDHLYVTDASNVANAIQVLSGNQHMEEGTVIMETREEHPDSGDVSVIQQNIVILSDYSGMEGTYNEMDGYTKEYSALDI